MHKHSMPYGLGKLLSTVRMCVFDGGGGIFDDYFVCTHASYLLKVLT